MNIDTTLLLLEQMLSPKGLNKVQKLILEKSLEGYSYKVMANNFHYSEGYLKDKGSALWQALSQTIGQPINKQNVCRLISFIQQQESFFRPNDEKEVSNSSDQREQAILKS